MAQATSATIQWKKVDDDGAFKKFTEIGNSAEGILISNITRDSKFEGKIERIIGLKLDDGKSVQISCPTDLSRKMSGVAIGSRVRITFVDTKQAAGGLMKLFEVLTADVQSVDRELGDVADDGDEASPFSRLTP